MINYFVAYFFIFSFGSLGAMLDYEIAPFNGEVESNEEFQLDKRLRALSFDEVIDAPDSASFKSPQVGGKRKKDILSPSQKNSKHIKKINDALSPKVKSSNDVSRNGTSTPPPSDIFNFSTPELKILNSYGQNILKLIDTPGGTKGKVINHLAARNNNAIIAGAIDEVDKNNRLNNAYANPSSITGVIVKNSHYLSSPYKQKASSINLDHVEYPQVTYDSNGEPIKIVGGHHIQPYFAINILHENDDVFVGDHGVLGTLINNQIPKTFYPRFSAHEIISNVKEGRTIAKTTGSFKISKSPVGYFVGTYKDATNQLQHTSQFPLITLTDADQDEQLYVGQFAKLNADGSVNQDSAQQPLYISKSDFDNVIQQSATSPKNIIPAASSGTVVCNITEALQEHFSSQLNSHGRKSFPVPIYGIKTR